MDIRMYVSKKGQVALACFDGGFSNIVERVALDCTTLCVYVYLKNAKEPVMLNCPIDPYMAVRIGEGRECAVGYYAGGKLAGSFLTPFEMTNRGLLETDDIMMDERMMA